MTSGNLLPELIEAALVELTDLGFELTRLAAGMEEREDLHLCAILNARDEHGKPTYSNEDRRLIEFRQRLRDDELYQRLLAEQTAKRNARARLEAKVERLRGHFKLHLLDRRESVVRREEAVT
jgi:hypothetical protein